MTTATLTNALSGLDPKKSCEIWARVSQHSSTLFGDASREQLKQIALDLDKVSQGTGLEIIGVVIWPDDSIPESLNGLVARIRSALGLVDDTYFQALIGMPIADFMVQFSTADSPIDEAICHLLYKLQAVGLPVPQDFTAQAKRYIVESLA